MTLVFEQQPNVPLGWLSNKDKQVNGKPKSECNCQQALEEGLLAFNEIENNLNSSRCSYSEDADGFEDGSRYSLVLL